MFFVTVHLGLTKLQRGYRRIKGILLQGSEQASGNIGGRFLLVETLCAGDSLDREYIRPLLTSITRYARSRISLVKQTVRVLTCAVPCLRG